MAEQLTLAELDQQITHLPPQDQLMLVTYISERLRDTLPPSLPAALDEAAVQQAWDAETAALLARLDAVAALTVGEGFDSAEEIRQMRRERDEQIWPSR